jgi:hypothetical protein
MQYQLTLQFRGGSLDNDDAMVALEDELEIRRTLTGMMQVPAKPTFSFSLLTQHLRFTE